MKLQDITMTVFFIIIATYFLRKDIELVGLIYKLDQHNLLLQNVIKMYRSLFVGYTFVIFALLCTIMYYKRQISLLKKQLEDNDTKR